VRGALGLSAAAVGLIPSMVEAFVVVREISVAGSGSDEAAVHPAREKEFLGGLGGHRDVQGNVVLGAGILPPPCLFGVELCNNIPLFPRESRGICVDRDFSSRLRQAVRLFVPRYP